MKKRETEEEKRELLILRCVFAIWSGLRQEP
jgi:hypothetical protein